MTADEDKLARAKKVAEHVRRAAEELTAAADELPVCDCAVLDEEHMARVVHDLGKAERAVINVHSGLRLLEQKHEGGPVGLATLETQPLEGLRAPGQPRILEQVAGLAEQAANESTGGQCC